MLAQALILLSLLAVEVFAVLNMGGGPLLSHLVFAAAVFGAVSLVLFGKTEWKFRWNTVNIFLAVFLVFFLISYFFSQTSEYGLSELLLMGNSALLFFVISGMKMSARAHAAFGGAMALLAVVMTLAGFYWYANAAFPRLAGTFFDHTKPQFAAVNAYANFLVLILPFALFQYFRWSGGSEGRRLTTTVLWGVASTVLLSGLLLSFSRAAWISLVAAGLAAAAFGTFMKWKNRGISRAEIDSQRHAPYGKRQFLRPAILALALLVAIVALTGFFQISRARIYETTPLVKKLLFQADEEGASAGSRLEYWRGAAWLIAEKPAFGSGAQSFRYLFPRYQKTFGIVADHPHNMILKLAVENGVFAATAFLIFLCAVGISTLRGFLRNASEPHAAHSPAIVPFFIGAVAAFLHNLLDFNFIVSNFMLAMGFLAFTVPVMEEREKTPRLPSQKIIKAVLFSLGALIFFIALHEGAYQMYLKRGREALEKWEPQTAVFNLEKAGKLFFERNRALLLAAAYRLSAEKEDPAVAALRSSAFWRDKEKELLESTTDQKSVYAEAYSRLAEIAHEEGEGEKAFRLMERAVYLDPTNSMKYHYQLWEYAPAPDSRYKEDLKKLLAEYKEALRKNRNFTVLTDNPKYAVKLAEALGMEEEQRELEAIWFQELYKFASKYGGGALRK